MIDERDSGPAEGAPLLTEPVASTGEVPLLADDDRDAGPDVGAPLLTEQMASTGEVPVLTDEVIETLRPAPAAPQAGGTSAVSPATVAALREALTVVAQDLTRDCLEEVLADAREALDRKLSGRFEEDLRELVERALRAHLDPHA